MSVSQIFTIVGDGNVRRNMTALNIASRTSMKNAQIVDHVGGTLEQALQVVKPETNVCIIASITDGPWSLRHLSRNLADRWRPTQIG